MPAPSMSTKTAAKKSTAKKRSSAKRSSSRRGKSLAEQYGVSKGDRTLSLGGAEWSSIACGKHNAIPVHESSTDTGERGPAGFQPNCEGCKDSLRTTVEHAHRYGTF